MSVFDLPRVFYRDLRGIETEPRSDKEHLESAIEWLYRSQDVTNCGGSAAYYSLLTGWSGPYPETSGYIIPTLYDYAEYSDSDEARRRAERMARWLLGLQFENGAFPEGIDPGPNADPSVFNTGQILFGLIRAYEETGDREFLDAADRAGAWLISVQHEKGYWNKFDYRGEIHSYCSRVAWALLELYKITKNQVLLEGAKINLEWVVSIQTDNHWFENAAFSSAESPYLHTIAYTIRGLLEGGIILEDDEYIYSAKSAADALLNKRHQQGSLQGRYDGNWNGDAFYCLTGNAQMIIIWNVLHNIFNEARYDQVATSEIEFLKAHQHLFNQTKLHGAIKGSHPVWGSYMRFRYPNWSVKFFTDSLLIFI